MKTAIYPGSFDPITLGHLDVIRRAAVCFDQVCVCVMANCEKKHPMFTPEERLEMIRSSIADLPNVEAELHCGLLVKGVRGAADFEQEYQMAHINQGIWSELETVLIPASAQYQHVSSTMAREMIRYHQPLEQYLPAPVAEKLKGR